MTQKRHRAPAYIELHYIPCQAFISALRQFDLYLEVHETYQKRSFRNKCLIASAQGVSMLSVPLLAGKHQQLPIQEVEISYAEDWRRQHLRTIHTCYRSAPFYMHYIDAWEELLKHKYRHLVDLNEATFQLVCRQMGVSDAYQKTSAYQKDVETDLRGLIHPRNYSQFAQQPYQQVFAQQHPFEPNLSALDLIFCTGPEARSHLSALDAYL